MEKKFVPDYKVCIKCGWDCMHKMRFNKGVVVTKHGSEYQEKILLTCSKCGFESYIDPMDAEG